MKKSMPQSRKLFLAIVFTLIFNSSAQAAGIPGWMLHPSYMKAAEEEKDITLIRIFASVIYGEAAGEPFEGQKAVAVAFINRWKNPRHRYGHYLVEVLAKGSAAFYTQSPQYRKAWTQDLNGYERIIYNRIERYCEALLKGSEELFHTGTHFEYIEAYGVPDWAPSMEVIGKYGNHTFYKEK